MSVFLERILDFLAPPYCQYCWRVGAWICADCRAIVFEAYGKARRVEGLTSLQIGFRYNKPLEKILRLGKESGYYLLYRELGRFWKEELAQSAGVQSRSEVTVVPVPLAIGKLRERGFNQLDYLAEGLGLLGNGRYQRWLVRKHETKTQIGNNRETRLHKLKGVFTVDVELPPPRQVILLDDVLTTGATLQHCATALREWGVVEVHGLVLARG